MGASECHGVLCGMLCTAHALDVRLWLRHATGHNESFAYDDDGPEHVFLDVARHTSVCIDEIEVGFQPLIADAGAPLAERVRDVGAWCRGFISGLGLGAPALEELSGDSREFLRDVERIAQVDERVDGDEDDERALMEILEYVRIGVLLLREETRARASRDDELDTPAAWH